MYGTGARLFLSSNLAIELNVIYNRVSDIEILTTDVATGRSQVTRFQYESLSIGLGIRLGRRVPGY